MAVAVANAWLELGGSQVARYTPTNASKKIETWAMFFCWENNRPFGICLMGWVSCGFFLELELYIFQNDEVDHMICQKLHTISLFLASTQSKTETRKRKKKKKTTKENKTRSELQNFGESGN